MHRLLLRDRREYYRRKLEQFDDITFINLFGQKVVLVLIPDGAQAVAMNLDKALASGPSWGMFIGLAFRRGILLLDFEEHRLHRSVMQSAFSSPNLKGYLQEMQPMLAGKVTELPAGQVQLAHAFKAISLSMALEVFVGVKLPKAEADRITQAFLDCLASVGAFIRFPIPGGDWARAIAGRKTLEAFFRDLLPQKRATQTPDLFSVLCHAKSEQGDVFSDEDVVNHMIFVLFAAHDTSTVALTTMAYYMARDRRWQDKARARALSLPGELAYEHLAEMTELDWIMKEALRLNSPVPWLARQALRDTTINGYYIPAGTMVMAPTGAIHANPRVWQDPYTFDPERFSPERAEDKGHRFRWMPFGGGVHKCIGLYFAQMEIKTILHHLLRNFEWTVPEDYRWTLEPRSLGDPVDGLPVQLRRLGTSPDRTDRGGDRG
ncbi:cytochrome P450 [Mycolicibacterium moriokaense]|uniref:Cytochrome P450 n=2 Tax=Mycolicibacterium moriokaense TaxID=39691 RepID=A0A318HA31_9MYCO|nr:cytochrome P450 [Mycolicibacterium moriokaense]